MNLNSLSVYCLEVIEKYPSLEDSVKDAFDLARSEIAAGEDELHEVELAGGYIEELVEDLLEELSS